MRIFFIFLFFAFSLFTQIVAQEKGESPTESAKEFAEKFSKKVLLSLSLDRGIDTQERKQEFRNLLHEGFAMKSIGQASVGRFWSQATDEEKAQFHKLFEDFFVDIYLENFKSYKVTEVKIVDAKQDDDGVWVKTIVKQKDKQDVIIEWKVVKGKESLKIINVMVDQFLNFMLNLQKAFVDVIASNGGEFGSILKELKEKTHLEKLTHIEK